MVQRKRPRTLNPRHGPGKFTKNAGEPFCPPDDNYDADGNVTRIVRKVESDDFYTATRLVYNKGGQVEFVVGEQWDQAEDTPTGDLDWKEIPFVPGEVALTLSPMTWQDARDYAISRGGDLVSIPYGGLSNLAAAFDPGTGYPVSYWVGAVQDPDGDETADGWDWLDTEVVFSGSLFWLPDEPDDGSGGTCPPTNCQDHDVATLTYPAGTKPLADDDATATYYGLIQRPTGTACDASDTKRNYERTFAWKVRASLRNEDTR